MLRQQGLQWRLHGGPRGLLGKNDVRPCFTHSVVVVLKKSAQLDGLVGFQALYAHGHAPLVGCGIAIDKVFENLAVGVGGDHGLHGGVGGQGGQRRAGEIDHVLHLLAQFLGALLGKAHAAARLRGPAARWSLLLP